MKNRTVLSLIIFVIAVFAFSAFMPSSVAYKSPDTSDIVSNEFDSNKVLETRFLNMLNHNNVYNDDINDCESIVNDSITGMLNLSSDNSFIKQEYVKDFIYNMYGVEIDDSKAINVDFPQKDGYFYIIPRGFTKYQHTIKSVTENEDGSYTVLSDVQVIGHDSTYCTSVSTLFVKNESSDFGFNIITCDFVDNCLA